MNSFERNKIMGAVLGTALFIMGVSLIAEAIYKPAEDEGPGYALPVAEATTTEVAAGEAAPAAVSIATLLASADATRGAASVKKCAACHTFGEGEANKTGPHLYDVVGRAEGSVEGFAYSAGMLAHNAAGDVWTYENLDHFLTKPSDYVAGTKMAFGGVKTAEERADILAYLQTLSANPVPFPAADAAPAAAAPAEAAPAAAPAEAAPAAAAPAEAAPAPAAETAPAAAPAAAIETPTTTSTETPVVGTPAATAPAAATTP